MHKFVVYNCMNIREYGKILKLWEKFKIGVYNTDTFVLQYGILQQPMAPCFRLRTEKGVIWICAS